MTISQATITSPIPEVGQYWAGQGGIYAGVLPSTSEHPAQHLIFSTDEGVDLAWGLGSDPIANSASDGAANTLNLVRHGDDFPAAKWAHEYEKDGHHDFHLPSRQEWQFAATTIKDQFSNNAWYWTSTEYDYGDAYGENFAGVPNEHFYRAFHGNVRAARTIPAPEYDTPARDSTPAIAGQPPACAPAVASHA
ncbi:MAG: hypothetical protein ACTHKH_15730 [Trinickia sp.]